MRVNPHARLENVPPFRAEQVAEKLCLQAAQKDLRGEAISRTLRQCSGQSAYESFSAAC
jgi:hypothetical protein